ncbi:MAG: hypothetical protein ACRCT8_09975 [Lacipirellulaceae bacterium]
MRWLTKRVVCVAVVGLACGLAWAAPEENAEAWVEVGAVEDASPFDEPFSGDAFDEQAALGDDAAADGAACESEACEDAPCDSEACEDAPCEDAVADEDPDCDGGAADDTASFEPTHHQVAILPVNVEGAPKGSLHTFCLAPDGRILAACSLDGVVDSASQSEESSDEPATDEPELDLVSAETPADETEEANGSGSAPTKGDVRVLSPSGELLGVWSLGFAPEAINVGSDGKVYVAGAGKLARYTLDGELVNEADGPHVEALVSNRDALREEVIEQHKSSTEWMTEYVGDLEGQIERLDAEVARLEEEAADAQQEAGDAPQQPSDATAKAIGSWFKLIGEAAAGAEPDVSQLQSTGDLETQKALRDSLVEQKKQYEEMIEQQGESDLTDEQVEERVKSSIAYKIKVASISEADGDVFLATGAAKGYGFSVWRTTRHFDSATKIVDQLSGCCGQMDVQACCDGVFVAENSRKRVAAFDRTGESLRSWGSSGEEVTGFGCCCNPMNVAFGPEGSVYTAESTSGRIKRYSTEGELIELVGSVDLVPGCKKVAIAVGPAGDRVYMLDQTRHHVVVMERRIPDSDKLSAINP